MSVEIGTKVRTRYGWTGEVLALDCALALVQEVDQDGRLQWNGTRPAAAWERIDSLKARIEATHTIGSLSLCPDHAA